MPFFKSPLTLDPAGQYFFYTFQCFCFLFKGGSHICIFNISNITLKKDTSLVKNGELSGYSYA